MKKLIDLTDKAFEALKNEAEANGRNLKKHIEYLLEQRAVEIIKFDQKQSKKK